MSDVRTGARRGFAATRFAAVVVAALAAGCGHQDAINPGLDLQSVHPSSGPSTGGGTVDIEGKAFDDTIAVTIGGVTAPIDQVLSRTRARVRVPTLVGRIGFVDVQVTKGAQSEVLRDAYRVYAAAPDFDTFRSFPTSFIPFAGTVADLDQNGTLDFALAASAPDGSDGAVIVLLATSAGVFGDPEVVVRTPRPVSITAADVDRDGRTDLIVSENTSNEVLVLRNLGGGGFAPPAILSTHASPAGLVAADVNGDLLPDVVVATSTGTFVDVFLNSAATPGTFASTPVSTQVAGQPVSVAAGDLDGDGAIDLAVVQRVMPPSGRLTVLWGDGTGNFPVSTDVANVAQPVDVAIADIDGDATSDVLYVRGSTPGRMPALGWVRNGGGRLFDPARELALTRTPFSFSMGDANGDGRPDALISSRDDGELDLFEGTGNATSAFASAVSIAAGTDSVSAVVALVDSDQLPDVVTASESGRTASVILGSGTAGSFVRPESVDLGAPPEDVVAADVDGNGSLECVVALGSSGVALLRTNSAGGFADPILTSVPGTPTLLLPLSEGSIAAVGSTDAMVHRLFPLPDGTFEERASAPPIPGLADAQSILSADLNGDSIADLVLGSGADGSVRVLRGRADGGFDALDPFPAVDRCAGLAAADWNGDGRVDLVVADSAQPRIAVVFGIGDGTFALPPLDVPLAANATALAKIDANGDSIPDLLVGESGASAEARMLVATGTGTFTDGASVSLATAASRFVIADWNFDGFSDVLAIEPSSNLVALYLGQSDRSLASQRSYGVESAPAAAIAFELNAEQPLDIVVGVRTSGSGSLDLLTNLAR
jgi:VCBS repeat protein/IPT/TIG domain-containing protein